jgi:Cu+-exporting ATPase
MSVMTATGRGAQAGVLVKDAAALERLSEVDVLVVDKTGTLTKGEPTVTSVQAYNGSSESDVLRLAASLEHNSLHPLAHAVLAAANDSQLELHRATDVSTVSGLGIKGRIQDDIVALGNRSFMELDGIDATPLVLGDEVQNSATGSEILVAKNGSLVGRIRASDAIKTEARNAINALKNRGINVVLATGDNVATASAVATELNLTDVHAGMLPEDKLKLIEELQNRGHVVAMVGDGINDAPALAKADIGIAMGTGTAAAMESAAVTLLKGDLMGVLKAHKLSKLLRKNVKQNLFFAFAYNAIGVPIAAGVLFPLTGWLLSPMLAAAAMSLSSVSVITNALRLRSVQL